MELLLSLPPSLSLFTSNSPPHPLPFSPFSPLSLLLSPTPLNSLFFPPLHLILEKKTMKSNLFIVLFGLFVVYACVCGWRGHQLPLRSEEHTSELQSR